MNRSYNMNLKLIKKVPVKVHNYPICNLSGHESHLIMQDKFDKKKR